MWYFTPVHSTHHTSWIREVGAQVGEVCEYFCYRSKVFRRIPQCHKVDIQVVCQRCDFIHGHFLHAIFLNKWGSVVDPLWSCLNKRGWSCSATPSCVCFWTVKKLQDLTKQYFMVSHPTCCCFRGLIYQQAVLGQKDLFAVQIAELGVTDIHWGLPKP